MGSESLIHSFRASRSLTHDHSAVAPAHHNKNEKTTEQLIAEIRNRRDWIGVDILGGPEDKGSGVENGKVETKSVRLLDYGCGTGLIARVSHSLPPSDSHFRDSDGA